MLRRLVVFLSIAVGLGYAQTVTPNLDMQLPAHGAANWDTEMNGNFNILDSLFGIPSCGDGTHAVGWDATGKVITCQTITPGTGTIVGMPSLGNQVAGNGAAFAAQGKPILDVRDYGVVGNGIADDTTAMQNAVNAACNVGTAGGKTLQAPPNTVIAVSSTISFANCQAMHVDFNSGQGEASWGSSGFVWIGADGGGPVVYINRTRDSIFENFFILQGKSGGGQANVALDIDETGAGNNIVTNNHYSDIAIGFIQGAVPANPNFVGVRLGHAAPGNVDGQQFNRVRIQCPGPSPTTTNSNGIGIFLDGSGGAEPYGTIIKNSPVSGCSRAYAIQNAADVIDIDGGIIGRNYTDLYVANGAGIKYHNIRSESSLAQIVANGNVELDNLAFSGLTAATTTISLSGAAPYILDNLTWDSVAVTPISSANSGPVSVSNSKFPQSTCPQDIKLGNREFLWNNSNYSSNCDSVFRSTGSSSSFGVVNNFPGQVNNSPLWYWAGNYLVSAGVWAQHKFSAQAVISGGANGATKLAFTSAGSTGPTTYSFDGGVTNASVLFANLPASANGTLLYCSDCKNVTDDTTGTFDSAAASGGHGTNVLRENGAWRVH